MEILLSFGWEIYFQKKNRQTLSVGLDSTFTHHTLVVNRNSLGDIGARGNERTDGGRDGLKNTSVEKLYD